MPVTATKPQYSPVSKKDQIAHLRTLILTYEDAIIEATSPDEIEELNAYLGMAEDALAELEADAYDDIQDALTDMESMALEHAFRNFLY